MVRLRLPETRHGDFLDKTIDDMKREKFLTEDFITLSMLGILFAGFESISTTLTLSLEFLAENPAVVDELRICISIYYIKFLASKTLASPFRLYANYFVRLRIRQFRKRGRIQPLPSHGMNMDQ